MEFITETSRNHHGLDFLLLSSLTNFKWILNTQGVEPFILNLPPLFITKIEEVLAAELAQASWLLIGEAF